MRYRSWLLGLTVPVGAEAPTAHVEAILMRRSLAVVVEAGSSYGAEGEGFLRICFGLQPEAQTSRRWRA